MMILNDRTVDDRLTNLTKFNIVIFYKDKLRNYELKIGDIYDAYIVRLSSITWKKLMIKESSAKSPR